MRAPISVVIPCYRCADTIERAVESVIAQTLLPREIILVDDFSNDDGKTLAALDGLRQTNQETSIRILRLDKNSGSGSARNAAWEASLQPYLAFLDADDSWHPQKLDIQYNWMVAHPDVVMSGHASIKIDAGTALPDLPRELVAHRVHRNRLLFSNRFPTRSVMLKREVSYRFISDKRYAEDYLLWLTIVFNQPAWFLNMPMAYTFKEEFGESGLTGNLWEMERGELDTFQRVYFAGLITFLELILASGFSYLKYCRRWIIVRWRSVINKHHASTVIDTMLK
jgi:glycosyltransferase involved in cell wall biosynthesis